jgi:hypothetical protein
MKKIKPSKPRKSLPSKLSSLVRVAVADMDRIQRLIEKARVEGKPPAYEFNMGTWHRSSLTSLPASGRRFQQCSVCFAGSVMAGTLGVPQTRDIGPLGAARIASRKGFGDGRGVLMWKLQALNHIRLGEIVYAFRAMRWWEPKLKNITDAAFDAMADKMANKIATNTLVAMGKFKTNVRLLPERQLIKKLDPLNFNGALANAANVAVFLGYMSTIADMLEREGF